MTLEKFEQTYKDANVLISFLKLLQLKRIPVMPIQDVSYRCGVKYVSSPERRVNRIQRLPTRLVTGIRHLPYD